MAHPARDLQRNVQLLARADEENVRARSLDEHVGQSGEAFGGPALRAAVGRAGAERDERALKTRAVLTKQSARKVLPPLGDFEADARLARLV